MQQKADSSFLRPTDTRRTLRLAIALVFLFSNAFPQSIAHSVTKKCGSHKLTLCSEHRASHIILQHPNNVTRALEDGKHAIGVRQETDSHDPAHQVTRDHKPHSIHLKSGKLPNLSYLVVAESHWIQFPTLVIGSSRSLRDSRLSPHKMLRIVRIQV